MTAVAPVAEVQECPSFFVSVGGLCLFFMTWVEESWEESRQTCHDMSGELAAVTDIEQLRAIYLYMHQEGIAGHSFWLGGSDAAQEGVWLWTEGQRVPMEEDELRLNKLISVMSKMKNIKEDELRLNKLISVMSKMKNIS
nr:LOW QUALITY PROTEIN: galactose-specific lectin nattectin-like [Cherax quadricarinatus]